MTAVKKCFSVCLRGFPVRPHELNIQTFVQIYRVRVKLGTKLVFSTFKRTYLSTTCLRSTAYERSHAAEHDGGAGHHAGG